MRTQIAIAGILIGIPLFAQTSAQRPSFQDGGTQVMHVTPTVSPTSLLQLIRASTLIVDGSVSGALPVINTNKDPNARPRLETHSIVAVNSVMSGTVPNSSAKILIAQIGGHLGNWDLSVEGDPLLSVGERYVFFLIPDTRKEVPNDSGMPRFAITGVWSGKVKLINGRASFSAIPGSQLSSYNNLSADSFLQTLRTTISRPYTDADAQLPINLAPQH